MNTRWKPHVTVAAIIESNGLYLLVEENTSSGLRLNNPAGHLERGESPEQGVVREVLEETGRVFTPEAVVGVYLSRFQRGPSREDITYVRLAFAGSASEPLSGWVLDEGIVRTVWMDLATLRACPERHRSPLVLRCLEDHAAGIHFALSAIVTDASVANPKVELP